MAFEGGPLSRLGITPAFVNNLAQQTAATGVTQALGQVWQGAGQSFVGQAGQALAGNLASSAVNVVINSALGSQISGPGGFPINTGGDFLASTITPYVTSSLAAGINQNIQQSLQSAGPFGQVLSGVATGLVTQVANSLTGTIAGLGGPQGEPYKTFPGAGGEGEAPANYGGRAYTLGLTGGDVVFAIQPANQGPQSFGDSQGLNDPKTATTVAANQVAGAGNMPSGQNSSATDPMAPVSNQVKAEAMAQGQPPLRPEGPLWPGDGDSQAPLRPEGPLWGSESNQIPSPVWDSGVVQGTRGAGYTEEFDITIAQRAGTRQAGYLRQLEGRGINPNDVRALRLTSKGYGSGSTYVGYYNRTGTFVPWPETGNRPSTGPQTGNPPLW